MWLQQARVGAFGPLRAGDVLDLAPGLTVVWGPNEAGKSSWHAALFAGLCGIRRGPGRTAEQRELQAAHRPWGGSAWEVAVTVECADGRVLELRHDLDNPEHSRVTDRDTGADLTGGLVFDGGPDGALLLGLTRRTLPPTIMVRQAQMLACTERAEELQQTLQRAAATAGDAATADEAIGIVEKVRAESVGSEQARTRPLARARAGLTDADEQLAAARADHADYVALRAEHDEVAADAAARTRHLARLDAEAARREAAALTGRAAEAEQLAARMPAPLVAEVEDNDGEDGGDGEPADPEADLAARVAAARTGWQLRPAEPDEPQGPRVDELRAALTDLPETPEGDTEVAAEVESAAGSWRDAHTALERHDRREPARAAAPVDADAATLREAAASLAGAPSGVDDELAERVRALQADHSRRGRTRTLAGGAAAVAALGLAASVAAGQAGLAAVAAALAVALTVAAVVAGRFPQAGELAEARAELAAQRRDAAKDAERRQQAEAMASRLGVPAKPDRLRELAADVERAGRLAAEREAWAAERADLAGEVEQAELRLRQALTAHGVELAAADPDLEGAVATYRKACRDRAEQARLAARREDLEARLIAREAADHQADSDRRRRREADEALAAAACAVAAESAEAGDVPAAVAAVDGAGEGTARATALAELDRALAAWQDAYARRRRERSLHERDRARLATLLGGRTHAQLQAAADEWQATADARLAALDAAAADLSDLAEIADRELRRQREEAAAAAETARTRAAEVAGSLQHHESTLLPVAEAEEERERRAAEVERLESLGAVLDAARAHLRAASERVNRDVAPRLRATVERWLPSLTGGRYARVAVDPGTLEVTVDAPGGGWQPAGRLSHGTSEQVYLLLRVALAEHLVTTDEAAPLLLDDVTAQSDDERTEAILQLLAELAADRQVVLFTQETAVRDWARAHLPGDRDRLVVLDHTARRAGEAPQRTPTGAPAS